MDLNSELLKDIILADLFESKCLIEYHLEWPAEESQFAELDLEKIVLGGQPTVGLETDTEIVFDIVAIVTGGMQQRIRFTVKFLARLNYPPVLEGSPISESIEILEEDTSRDPYEFRTTVFDAEGDLVFADSPAIASLPCGCISIQVKYPDFIVKVDSSLITVQDAG